MSSRLVIRSTSNQFYFVLWSSDGERILQSEMYQAKASAQTGAQSVKANAGNDQRYERRTSAANQPYFVLKAANGEIIGVSEMYGSTTARDSGIASSKFNGPAAEIVDQT
jgi:uncharacterized protein